MRSMIGARIQDLFRRFMGDRSSGLNKTTWNDLPSEILVMIAGYVILPSDDKCLVTMEHLQHQIDTALFSVDRRSREASLQALSLHKLFITLKFHHCKHGPAISCFYLQHYLNHIVTCIKVPSHRTARGTSVLPPSNLSIRLSCEHNCQDRDPASITIIYDKLLGLSILGVIQYQTMYPNISFSIESFHPSTAKDIKQFLEDSSRTLQSLHIVGVRGLQDKSELSSVNLQPGVTFPSLNTVDLLISMLDYQIERIKDVLTDGYQLYELHPAIGRFLSYYSSRMRSLTATSSGVQKNHLLKLVGVYTIIVFGGLSEYLLRSQNTFNRQHHRLLRPASQVIQTFYSIWNDASTNFEHLACHHESGDFWVAIVMVQAQLSLAFARAALHPVGLSTLVRREQLVFAPGLRYSDHLREVHANTMILRNVDRGETKAYISGWKVVFDPLRVNIVQEFSESQQYGQVTWTGPAMVGKPFPLFKVVEEDGRVKLMFGKASI